MVKGPARPPRHRHGTEPDRTARTVAARGRLGRPDADRITGLCCAGEPQCAPRDAGRVFRFGYHHGMQVYLVGGAVRDELLGLPVKERDWVVVGATPQQMVDLGFRPVGKDFPVFLHPETGEEYALARTERKSGHGYHGFTVYTAPDVTLEDDLVRRDLTVNAMAEDEHGQVIDPHGGQRDLAARVLRHVSPAFAEDPVRILRLARFAARFHDFTVAEETLALMRQMVDDGEVDHLVAERVWQELARGLMEARPSRMFEVLRACGALVRLLPELDRLREELNQVAPNLIIALGSTACWALLSTNGIGALRGTVATSTLVPAKVLPTYHPAAVLRNWAWRPIAIADLIKAKRESAFPEIKRPERFILVNPTIAECEQWVAQNLKSECACDIETKFGMIEMIGFSASPTHAMVIPFPGE